jgi:hypothetical protein
MRTSGITVRIGFTRKKSSRPGTIPTVMNEQKIPRAVIAQWLPAAGLSTSDTMSKAKASAATILESIGTRDRLTMPLCSTHVQGRNRRSGMAGSFL